MSFRGAVEHIATGLSTRMDEAEVAAYVANPDRVYEAEEVQPLVGRFIDYEINPPVGGPGIGRYANRSFIPPLGELLGAKRVEALTGDEAGALRTAAERSIAEGYVGMLGPEYGATFDGQRLDLEDLWNIWIVRLNGDDALDLAGFATESQDILRANAEDQFVQSLRGANLFPKARKRMRYRLLGKWYGQAGMLLRLFQIGGVQGDPKQDLKRHLNSWPLEARPD